MNIYLIGSLRNPEVPKLANRLRDEGFEVFDDWFAAGPEADDKWREYEQLRGRTYEEALEGYAAKHVFEFDKRHLERCDAVILALPAGKSGHLELGWALGKGKLGYILLDTPDRWDVMYQFADLITNSFDELLDELKLKAKYPEFDEIRCICTRCHTPIRRYDPFVGDGDGSGQQFAHYRCFYGET